VTISGEMFEQTLASASPDVLREMIREIARRMMDADVEVRLQRGIRGGDPDRVRVAAVRYPVRVIAIVRTSAGLG
jgi:hypothetical protein